MKNTDSYFLICRLKKGDLASFEEVYRRYYSKLYGVSRKFESSTLEPDDFVQQTFLKLWEDRNQLCEDVLLDKQLFVICKQLILNHLKREQKIASNQDFFLSREVVPVEHEPEVNHRTLARLNSSLQKMPPKRREVFLLHKMENLSYKEISKYLNLSTKTIANHIYLASTFLKKEFRNK